MRLQRHLLFFPCCSSSDGFLRPKLDSGAPFIGNLRQVSARRNWGSPFVRLTKWQRCLRRSQHRLLRTPPPPRFGWSPSPAARGRMQDSVLAARSRPSFCSPLRQGRLPPLLRGKRSAERRMPIMSALRKQVYAVCATHLLRGCAPLSGARPPFGAHACGTRHRLSPRWLSSRTGFPQGTAFRSFARSPHAPCVKHAPCGLPVDRGPGAARERSAYPPRAGTAPCSVLRKCPRERRPLRAR